VFIFILIFQRLKPGDSMLSFRQCERHTFSMRSDREVRYSLTMQCLNDGKHEIYTTGLIMQKFGLGQKTCRSEVSTLSC
jgi:BTB/POZ domain-containing protein 16